MDQPRDLLKDISEALDKLYEIWEDIGFSKSLIIDRTSQVTRYCKNILDRMINEEILLKEEYQISVQNLHEKVAKLCQMLGHEPNPVDLKSSLCVQKQILSSRLEKLSIEKNSRLEELANLKKEEENLCKYLGEPMFIIHSSIPSDSEFTEYKKYINFLNESKKTKSQLYNGLRNKIVDIFRELQHTPTSDLENNLISEPTKINLTEENFSEIKELLENIKFQKIERESKFQTIIEKLKEIWRRLDITEEFRTSFLAEHNDIKISTLEQMENEYNRCRLILNSNLESYIQTLRYELKDLWMQCYVEEEEKQRFPHIISEEYSDELIELHEKEIEKWKLYLSETENIRALIEERNYLWDKMIHLEIQVKDTNRFKNRGGNLLFEEKERKKVSIKLPKIEYKIGVLIVEWEKKSHKNFLFHGTSFTDYIQQQWTQFYYNKEQEKENRMKAKKETTKLEMTYGCKPITPSYSKSKIYQSGNLNSILGTSSIHKTKKFSLTKLMSPKFQHSSLKNLQNRQIINKYKKRSSRIMRGHNNPRVSRKIFKEKNYINTPNTAFNSYILGITASAPPKDSMFPKMGLLTNVTPMKISKTNLCRLPRGTKASKEKTPERKNVATHYRAGSEMRPQKSCRDMKVPMAVRDKRVKQDTVSIKSKNEVSNNTKGIKNTVNSEEGEHTNVKGDNSKGSLDNITLTDSYRVFTTGLDKVEIPFCHSSQMEEYDEMTHSSKEASL